MRLCRFRSLNSDGTDSSIQAGFYDEQGILPLKPLISLSPTTSNQSSPLWAEVLDREGNLLPLLTLDHPAAASARELAAWVQQHPEAVTPFRLPLSAIQWELPLPRPNKLLFLARNYVEHIREQGGIVAERSATFPYVFLKPASTTLRPAGCAVAIPQHSPSAIDFEAELAVVIGRLAKHVSEADALSFVAGYTLVNDLTDRKFRPNPTRTPRERDAFFDWMHGKWPDGFCPCGPGIVTADEIPDPQQLHLQLRCNGVVRQDAATSLMIFPVAAIIAFLSSFITLEPGDIIATGTPAGVGHATGQYLQPGDEIEIQMEPVGTLFHSLVAES